MAAKKVILVTGAAGYFGTRVAEMLARQEASVHVIGLDDSVPDRGVRHGLDFVQAYLGNSLLAELLKEEAVDTVCHLALLESASPSEESFEINVSGTIKFLGACVGTGSAQGRAQKHDGRIWGAP